MTYDFANIMKGKFIVFYGINNLGKTTQARLLFNYLNIKGFKAEYIKYPIYDLEPSGLYLNKILRDGRRQKISEEELQMWFTINRFQYEPILKNKLLQGKIIIAEDYSGTGICWGTAKGAEQKWLEAINKPLLKEDIAVLFDGKRFFKGKEKNHLHERDNKLIERCRKIHLRLAKRFGWIIINANQPIQKVHQDIVRVVEKVLK